MIVVCFNVCSNSYYFIMAMITNYNYLSPIYSKCFYFIVYLIY